MSRKFLQLQLNLSFSLGYAFHVAAAIGTEGKAVFDRIQDAIAQADEVDSRFLQFEGGLSITGKKFETKRN